MCNCDERSTHLNFAHSRIADPVDVAGSSIQNRGAVLRRSRSAARMPNRRALQIHFLAIAERVAALRAPSASRVEMMVVSRLQDLAADVPLAVSALHAERLLIILLAVGLAVLAHVLAAQNRPADQAAKIEHQINKTSKLQVVFLTGNTKCAIVYPTLLELVLVIFETENY